MDCDEEKPDKIIAGKLLLDFLTEMRLDSTAAAMWELKKTILIWKRTTENASATKDHDGAASKA